MMYKFKVRIDLDYKEAHSGDYLKVFQNNTSDILSYIIFSLKILSFSLDYV